MVDDRRLLDDGPVDDDGPSGEVDCCKADTMMFCSSCRVSSIKPDVIVEEAVIRGYDDVWGASRVFALNVDTIASKMLAFRSSSLNLFDNNVVTMACDRLSTRSCEILIMSTSSFDIAVLKMAEIRGVKDDAYEGIDCTIGAYGSPGPGGKAANMAEATIRAPVCATGSTT